MSKNVREQILKILIKPTTVTELKEKIKDVKSFGTIAYHINELMKEGIITKNEKEKKGDKITYQVSSKEKMKFYSDLKKTEEDYIKKVLTFVKNKPNIERQDLLIYFEKLGVDIDYIYQQMLECENENYMSVFYKINPKGEKFLKQK